MAVSRCPRCGWKIANKSLSDEIRKEYPRAFTAWLKSEDEQLQLLVKGGSTLMEMAKLLSRQPSAIQRRIEMLKLRDCAPLPTTDNPLQYLSRADQKE